MNLALIFVPLILGIVIRGDDEGTLDTAPCSKLYPTCQGCIAESSEELQCVFQIRDSAIVCVEMDQGGFNVSDAAILISVQEEVMCQ